MATSTITTTAQCTFQVSSLKIGPFTRNSRLIVGSGRYENATKRRQSLALSGADCITVAVRRERLRDPNGENLLDYIDSDRYTLLPNTAGCYSAEDAARVSRMGREILRALGYRGADRGKPEAPGDAKPLRPDPAANTNASDIPVDDGSHLLCRTSYDLVSARRVNQCHF